MTYAYPAVGMEGLYDCRVLRDLHVSMGSESFDLLGVGWGAALSRLGTRKSLFMGTLSRGFAVVPASY